MKLGPVQKKCLRPPVMSHEERRKLIETPFMTRVIPGKTWGGCYVGHAGSVPTEGQKTWSVSPADEAYIRYGRLDDEAPE